MRVPFVTVLFFLTIKLFSYSPEELIEHVQKSLECAIHHKSKLTLPLLQIHGMSSEKNRHFLNNICTLEGINYLEIGVWKGSTFFSALYNNLNINSAVGVENWSLDPHTRDYYFANLKKFKKLLPANLRMIEKNCFKISLKEFKEPIQVYFYDGRHEEEDQRMAFTYFNEILDDVFIAIVDDWNHPPVESGTRIAFKELGYNVHKEWILPARGNGDLELWWNGLYVAVVEKSKNN
ncbi:MAG: class I SAM-dependent methyltransferase [Simkaniaceae bacterium]|nr:class I SAM-dependent methyltransferase [Simkaniaceae bacterium]